MAGRGEHVVRRLRARVRRCVDDARARELTRGALELAVFLGHRAGTPRGQLDVRTIEIADHHLGVAQAKAPADLQSHRKCRGRGQGDANGRLEGVCLCGKTHVVGAKVVAPLADQVRLVDDEESRSCTTQRVPRLHVRQLLRRDEDERVGVAGGNERVRPCTSGLLRVQDNRVEARRAEMGELVVL